jgi:hypothetical protein
MLPNAPVHAPRVEWRSRGGRGVAWNPLLGTASKLCCFIVAQKPHRLLHPHQLQALRDMRAHSIVTPHHLEV